MNLYLKRIATCNYGTFGIILRGNTPIMATLEPEIPIIPYGTFECFKRTDGKRAYPVFEFKHVPGHSNVQIHVGNTKKDTDGCVLVGMGFRYFGKNGYGLVSSREALNNLMDLYPDGLTISIC
jgi:hypothetical protein